MRVYQERGRWFVDWRDARGDRRRWGSFGRKDVAESFGQRLEELSEVVRAGSRPSAKLRDWLGLITPKHRQKLRDLGMIPGASDLPVGELVDQWEAALVRRERTKSHIAAHVGRVRLAVKRLGAVRLTDLTSRAVEELLSDLRAPAGEDKQGRSATTANAYLVALRAFIRWCAEGKHIDHDPLVAVRRIPVLSRKKVRLALSEDQASKLLAHVKGDRGWLYRVALETGLRWGELVSLTPSSFVPGKSPAVTVRAAYSRKSKRDRTVPLRSGTAKELKAWLKEKPAGAVVFVDTPDAQHAAEVFRQDLLAAGVEGANAFDFHCLRHTFLTRLAAQGVELPVLMALSGHTSPAVALQYIHVGEAAKREAVAGIWQRKKRKKP